MKILITGAAGMLGADLQEALPPKHQLVLTDITGNVISLDITDEKRVSAVMAEHRPDLVIHAAAYTDVDGCERDPDRAFLINGEGTRNVAAACRLFDAALLYISTDFVFDGEKREPYTENDVPNPINHYGASKLAGENCVRELCPSHYIVRTAWLYGEHGKNFPLNILNAAKSKKELKVVADQIGSPTFTADLAPAIRDLIESRVYGAYHITNKGFCSWYEFAKKTLSFAGINDVEIKPIKSEEWSSLTPRPKYSVLGRLALERQGKDNMRSWEEALQDFVSRLDI